MDAGEKWGPRLVVLLLVPAWLYWLAVYGVQAVFLPFTTSAFLSGLLLLSTSDSWHEAVRRRGWPA